MDHDQFLTTPPRGQLLKCNKVEKMLCYKGSHTCGRRFMSPAWAAQLRRGIDATNLPERGSAIKVANGPESNASLPIPPHLGYRTFASLSLLFHRKSEELEERGHLPAEVFVRKSHYSWPSLQAEHVAPSEKHSRPMQFSS